MRRVSRKKNSVKIFTVVTIFAAAIFAVSSYFLNKKNEVAIAKINGDKIFKSEIERKLRVVFDGQNQQIQIPTIENLPKEVIELLAKEIYFEKELTKKAEKSKAAKASETLDKITDAKNKILRQAYVDSLLKEEITDQKINEKYIELTNELAGKKEYLLSHIIVKTKEEAEKITKNLKQQKFADLAKKYSIDQESAEKGGELGYVLEDNVIKEIAEILPKLKKDEVSAAIKTKFGWHLIKIMDVRDAKALPFESVKDNIRGQLVQDKISEINSSIIKNAKIKILIKLAETKEKTEEIKAESKEKSDAKKADKEAK